MTESIEELALDIAQRNLSRQEANLDGLRTRTTGLVAAAGAFATLFANKLHGALHLAGWVGLIAFVAAVSLGLWILRPRPWKFSTDVTKLIDRSARQVEVTPKSARYAQREWAYWLERHKRENAATLRWLYRYFEAAVFLVGVEVLAWVARLV